MGASASFHINALGPLAKASVTAASTVTMTLDSNVGVRSVLWEIASTDGSAAPSAYPIAGATGFTPSFTAGAAGTAVLVRCTINGGNETDPITGRQSPGQSIKTAKVVVLTANAFEVVNAGETTEGDPTYGWTPAINAVVRAAGPGGGSSSVVTNAADGLAPAQSVTALTASSSTLLADPLGRENTIGPLVTALAIAAATVGAKCRFRFLGNGNDIVITPAGGTINGASTVTAKGSFNPNLEASLKCLIAGNWVTDSLGPSLPNYIAPQDQQIILGGEQGSGNGVEYQIDAPDGATGAFDGGGLRLRVGKAGATTNHPGVITQDLGAEAADNLGGRVDVVASAGGIGTVRQRMQAYNGGLRYTVGPYISFDAGSASGVINALLSFYFNIHAQIFNIGAGRINWDYQNQTNHTACLWLDTGTTGATPLTTICPASPPASSIVYAEVVAIFRDPVTGNGAEFKRKIVYKYDSTGPTWTLMQALSNDGSVDAVDPTFAAAWAAASITDPIAFAAAGTLISCMATGLAGVNFNVSAEVKYRWRQ